ncbi:hypothetical protein GQ600_18014 [Phytophthora cactorum]|nr:hypothetical protein GQ600_18014 [Phytophthora cactorum]
MADEQLQRDQAQLRAAINSVSSEALKTHMLEALSAFNASTSSTQSTPGADAAQSENDKSDAIASKLREKAVTVQKPETLFSWRSTRCCLKQVLRDWLTD